MTTLTKRRSTLLGVVGLTAALAGCGPYPDLKVLVVDIPKDATKLAVIMWRLESTPVPSNEMHVYDVIPSTGSAATVNYSLGVDIDRDVRNAGYMINVAAFDGADSKPCLRIATSGVQQPNFGLETEIAVYMPPLSEADFARFSSNPTKRCYSGVLAETTTPLPLIGSVSLDSTRPSDGNASGGTQFLIRGWGFTPLPTITATLGGMAKSVGRPVGLSASEISFSLPGVTLSEVAAMGTRLSVTVQTPDGSTTADVTFNGS